MNTRAKQVLIVAVGAVLALVMVFLGLWQAQVFVDKGNRTVQARAEQAPVPLLDFVDQQGRVGDVYGKPVSVTGRYLPGHLVTIPDADGAVRVLTALELADGRVLPVVRGVAPAASEPPAPPAGTVVQTGLFLPGEGDGEVAVGDAQMASVRMPLLAQRWTQQLVPGFVTLSAADAAAQGLAEASVTLPQGEGSLQNGGYALQWWVFAAFALGMSIKFASSVGAQERKTREDAARAELAPTNRKES